MLSLHFWELKCVTSTTSRAGRERCKRKTRANGCYGITIVLAFFAWTGVNDSNTLRVDAKFFENIRVHGPIHTGALRYTLIRTFVVNFFLRESNLSFNRSTHLICLHVQISLSNVSKG